MTQFDADYEADDDNTQTEGSRLRQQLEAQIARNKELEEAAAKATELERRLAFTEAKLPDTPMAAYFAEHYSGDATPDAIREEAAKLGLIQPPDQEQTEQVGQLDQFSQAAAGAPPVPPPGNEEQMWQEFTDALRKGEDSEAVLRRYGRPVASDSA